MESERELEAVRLSQNNETTHDPKGYTQKDRLSVDHPDYKAKVAEPTMAAVDGLPAAYREKVHKFGYVPVYRAWLHRIPPDVIEQRAERMGGRFVL